MIVEIIRVFPDVQSEDRPISAAAEIRTHDRVVLIGGGTDGKLAILAAQPRPTGAEAGRARLGKGFLKGIERAEGGVNRGGQVARGGLGSARSDHLPEHRVVDVTAAIVADHHADVFRHGLEVADQFAGAFRLEFRFAGDGVVDVGDIGGVVFAVMDFHGAGVDVGFERVEGESEFGEGVGHWSGVVLVVVAWPGTAVWRCYRATGEIKRAIASLQGAIRKFSGLQLAGKR